MAIDQIGDCEGRKRYVMNPATAFDTGVVPCKRDAENGVLYKTRKRFFRYIIVELSTIIGYAPYS
jgi:hypothetical protein